MRLVPALKAESREKAFCILFLIAASVYYCHRIFGNYYPVEGDVAQNIYFRLFSELMAKDHNPYQWHYTAFMPYSGRFNPIVNIIAGIASVFFVGAKPAAVAIGVSMAASAALLVLVCVSFFWVLNRLGFSAIAATTGAVIATFNGFHTVGVFELDHMYLLSYAAVPWVLYCFVQILQKENRWQWGFRLALVVGISLWGGTNSPLFLYLPIFFLAALWRARGEWKVTGPMVMGLALGCGIAAIILLPSVYYLDEINRAELAFKGSALPVWNKLRALFVSAHWTSKDYFPIHEVDYYVGLPALLLAGAGIWLNRRPAFLARWMLACLALGLLITNFGLLPGPLAKAVSFFYAKLSIRFHSRFHLLFLFPLAYFAAYAIDQRRRIKWGFAAAAGGIPLAVVLFFFFRQDFGLMRPDVQKSALLGIAFGLLAAGMAWAYSRKKAHPYFALAMVVSLFGSYTFVPSQYTRYSSSVAVAGPPSSWAGVLGLSWNYAEVSSRIEKVFEVPSGWSDPRTRVGRVYDPVDSLLRRGNYFAPNSGHRIALTLRSDPSSLRRLNQLAEDGSESVFDMMGICWNKDYLGGLLPRGNCLREALLIPRKRCLASDAEVLTEVRRASTPTFANVLFSRCAGEEPKGRIPVSGRISRMATSADRMRFEVDQPTAAYLFVSIPYRDDWIVEVNGQRTAVERANYAFMAVPVSAGSSVVEWRLTHRVEKMAFGLTAVFFMVSAWGGWISWPSTSYRQLRPARSKRKAA